MNINGCWTWTAVLQVAPCQIWFSEDNSSTNQIWINAFCPWVLFVTFKIPVCVRKYKRRTYLEISITIGKHLKGFVNRWICWKYLEERLVNILACFDKGSSICFPSHHHHRHHYHLQHHHNLNFSLGDAQIKDYC